MPGIKVDPSLLSSPDHLGQDDAYSGTVIHPMMADHKSYRLSYQRALRYMKSGLEPTPTLRAIHLARHGHSYTPGTDSMKCVMSPHQPGWIGFMKPRSQWHKGP